MHRGGTVNAGVRVCGLTQRELGHALHEYQVLDLLQSCSLPLSCPLLDLVRLVLV